MCVCVCAHKNKRFEAYLKTNFKLEKNNCFKKQKSFKLIIMNVKVKIALQIDFVNYISKITTTEKEQKCD